MGEYGSESKHSILLYEINILVYTSDTTTTMLQTAHVDLLILLKNVRGTVSSFSSERASQTPSREFDNSVASINRGHRLKFFLFVFLGLHFVDIPKP